MPKYDKFCGWSKNDREISEALNKTQYPLLGPASYQIKESGAGKTILLYQYIIKAAGAYNYAIQGGPDCVSFGHGRASDILRSIRCVMNGEEWISEVCREAIYGYSRVEIGGGKLGNGGGSYGGWACRALQEYGILLRQKYDKIDLTQYDKDRAYEWGINGVPDILDISSRQHPIRTYSLIKNFNEARDAAANGYGLTVACNLGFTRKKNSMGQCVRDDKGFLYKGDESWAHEQSIIAVIDDPKRPYVIIDNSWPLDWVIGPLSFPDQPKTSYSVDAEVFDEMVSQNDSWALSDYQGFPPRKISLRLL